MFSAGGQLFRIHYAAAQVTLEALGAAGADATADIPSLSEWGVVLLPLLLAASACLTGLSVQQRL